MANCKKCNSALEPNAKFCSACGANVTESAAQSTSSTETESKASTTTAKKRKFPLAIVIICISLAIIIAGTAVALAIINPFNGNQGGEQGSNAESTPEGEADAEPDYGTDSDYDHAIYLKDYEIYFANFDENKPIQLSTNLLEASEEILEDVWEDIDMYEYYLSEWCQYNAESNTVFYPDKLGNVSDWEGYINLYFRDLDLPQEGENSSPTKIDSSVQYYYVSEGGNLVTYLKSGEAVLYQYNIETASKEKIAIGVDWFSVNDDGSKIIFANEEHAIYIKIAGEEKEKLVSDIETIEYISDSLDTIYYTKDDALYKQVIGNDREKIISDVSDIAAIYDTGEIYFLKSKEENISYYDFVDDDLLAEDTRNYSETIVMPVEPTCEYDYYDYMYGYCTYEEYNNALAQYEIALTQYQKDYEEYLEQLDLFKAIEARNELRNELKAETDTFTAYSLHYFDGAEVTEIDDYIDRYSLVYAENSAVAAYQTRNSEYTKIKFSEIDDYYDVYSHIFSSYYYADYEQANIIVNGTSSEIALENICDYTISEDGDTIYVFTYTDSENATSSDCILYRIPIADGAMGESEELHGDSAHSYYYELISDGKLVYFADSKDDNGDLYVDGSNIDYDVYMQSLRYCEHTDDLIYFVDWSEKSFTGTLKIHSEDASSKIADDVYYFEAMSSGNIAYLYDYSKKYHKGALYYYNGKEAQKITDDVMLVIKTN